MNLSGGRSSRYLGQEWSCKGSEAGPESHAWVIVSRLETGAFVFVCVYTRVCMGTCVHRKARNEIRLYK